MGARHAALVSAHQETELVAVADPVSGVVAAEHGVPWYRTPDELLATTELDAVIIANPNRLHVETTLDCLSAGVAVLLEKPIATDYLESIRIVEASHRNPRLLIGHHRRHHPSIVAARAAIDAGRIGRIVAANGLWAARKHDGYFDDPWRREEGAGVMLLNLVHDLDLLRHLCGEVQTIQAIVSHRARGLPVEDTVAVNIEFESGAVGSFIASDAAPSPWGWDQSTLDSGDSPYYPDGVAFQVMGERGALSLPNLALFEGTENREPEWRHPMSCTYLPASGPDSYTNQLTHFVDVVRGDAAPLVTAEDASLTLAVVEAARFAAESGEAVDLLKFRAASFAELA